MRTDARPTRRSVLLAFLSPLRPQPRPTASRMTIVEGWARFFLWCGFTSPASFPAAA